MARLAHGNGVTAATMAAALCAWRSAKRMVAWRHQQWRISWPAAAMTCLAALVIHLANVAYQRGIKHRNNGSNVMYHNISNNGHHLCK